IGWLVSSKLNEPWTHERIISYLSNDFLQQVQAKYSTFETTVKLEFLFSFLSLRPKQLDELRSSISQIFDIARKDQDEWVQITSELLHCIIKDNSKVNVNITNKKFTKTLEELHSTCNFYL